MASPPTFWRSPRSRPALPAEEIEIPAPPPDPRDGSGATSLLTTFLPAVMMVGVMVLVGRAMGTSNWLLFSIPMILASSLAGWLSYLFQKRRTDQKAIERERRYRNILDETAKTLEALQQAQRRVLITNDPSPEVCLSRVKALHRSLWQRSPQDDDFLSLRVGVGNRLSSVTVKAPTPNDPTNPDPLVVTARELAQRFTYTSEVPIIFSLRELGVAGIAGPDDLATDALRALIVHLATHHSPDEVKIVAVYPAEAEKDWSWLRWLPHTWSEDGKRRFLADNPKDAHDLFIALDAQIDRRLNLLRDRSSSEPPVFLPVYVVLLLDDEKLTANELIVQKLETHGSRAGAFCIFLRERARQLPKSCQVFVRLDTAQSFLRITTPSTRDILIRPDRVSRAQAEEFARAMAPIRLQRLQAREIPATVSLLDLFRVSNGAERQVKTVDDLNILQRWQTSQRSQRSLAAPIGVKAGGELLILDLHERKHGPNGLVAGMVGAGKSELLQTLVASLAINYHPHKVGFVLVDYKGGGMADPFETLPHTLGVITNLQQGNLATRALTSFKVELERRMQLFKEASLKTGVDVNHIDTYQRLYYEGRVDEPLPYLVVIVDEFAEMKTEQPEVAKEFVKIARVGRAPGLCLILAMQKPAGIVDGQIEGNTRFRLCLRVASTEDSQAMLKRPDAAYLAGVGRAFLQVGANEIFEEFQVAWSGAQYDPLNLNDRDPLEITHVALNGQRTVLLEPSRPNSTQPKDLTQLKAVIGHLEAVARSQGIEKLRGLWLPPLPDRINLQDIRPAEGWNGSEWLPAAEWLAPVVGLVDDPRHQRQYPLRIPLGREGHLIVYGAPGYGKTTFVQTLITSLALTYSPNEVHVYVIDFGGRFLKHFEVLPHVGNVVTADENERLKRLFRFLVKELDQRREKFGKAGVGTFQAYRSATGDPLPAIVVILDNYARFREEYEEDEEIIAQLVRDGATLGIHVVLTVNDSSSVRFKITSNINLAVAMQMVEAADYAAIVGRAEGLVPSPIPGRGLVRGKPPLEFQTALPAHGDNDAERARNLHLLLTAVTNSWSGQRAAPIRVMPPVVALSEILSSETRQQPSSGLLAETLSVPLGLWVATLEPFAVSLDLGPNFLVTGPARSGKTTLLQTWILCLAEYLSPAEVCFYIFDSKRAGLAALQHLPHVKKYSCDSLEAEVAFEELAAVFEQRRQMAEIERRTHLISASESRTSLNQAPAIVVVVDDMLDPYNDITSDNVKNFLTSFLRQGRGIRCFAIIAGPSEDLQTKGWIDPIKTLKSAQLGFMLGRSDDSVFNLRLPYPERDKTLPPGEAYWVHQGQSARVKLATPQAGSLTLTGWVERLRSRYTDGAIKTHFERSDDVPRC
ncbi:MAG: type VII secretion protein EssC [Candidatus Methanomethylicaceae archaeon]